MKKGGAFLDFDACTEAPWSIATIVRARSRDLVVKIDLGAHDDAGHTLILDAPEVNA